MTRKTSKKCHRGQQHTRKRGGAINKLPGIPKGMKLAKFRSEWDVFYIRAHGSLDPDVYEVPANTYILHTVPSTIPCTFRVNSEQLDKFYMGNDNTLGYNEEFMEFIEDPRSVFPSIYKDLPNNASVPDITSIYEPNDLVSDVILSFASHVVRKQDMAQGGSTHFIVPGIFKLPMSKAVKSERNSSIRDIQRKLNMNNTKLQKELTEKDTEFINLRENLLKPILARNPGITHFNLSEIIKQPELQASAGKERFIIVHACKSLTGLDSDPKKKEIIKASLRRASVNRIRNAELARSLEKLRITEAAAAPAPAAAVPKVVVKPAAVANAPKPKASPSMFARGFLLDKPKPKPKVPNTIKKTGE